MPATLGEVLVRAAERWPDELAVVVDGEAPLTYAELLAEASTVAAALENRHPDARHVAILLPNSTRWVASLYGCALAGRTAVLLNPRLRDPELLYQVTQSDADVLVVGDAPERPMASLLAELGDQGPAVVWDGEDPPAGTSWTGWTAAAGEGGPLPGADPGATAAIIYTSGTTALPKGVMLSHASVVWNAGVVARRFDAGPADRIFCAGPFFHSGGLTMHVVLSALVGATAQSVPRFEPGRVLDIVEGDAITLYSGIETLFLRLLTAPSFRRERMRTVRTGWSTGTPAILASIADDVGVPGVVAVYGISEAAPNVLMSDHDDTREHRLETVGRPQPDTDCDLLDPVTGEPVGTGRPGELLVRGPGLMQGYYAKPEETAEALRDGWLHTGDLLVRRDDGYFVFAGRAKDIVRTGGENVSCAEVEDALYRLGGFELAALVGLEDPTLGQVAVAAVTPAADVGFSEDEILERLRATLSGYKVPRRVVAMDSMPLTESGKVQKGPLREELARILERP